MEKNDVLNDSRRDYPDMNGVIVAEAVDEIVLAVPLDEVVVKGVEEDEEGCPEALLEADTEEFEATPEGEMVIAVDVAEIELEVALGSYTSTSRALAAGMAIPVEVLFAVVDELRPVEDATIELETLLATEVVAAKAAKGENVAGAELDAGITAELVEFDMDVEAAE